MPYPHKITHDVELNYPRSRLNANTINIGLIDVRAANNIEVSYDFERDGWSIVSDMYDIENRREREPQEVAFIPAWPGND